MWNILVHGYFHVDTEIVWDTVQRDVPSFKPAVERLLHRLAKEGDDCALWGF